MKKSTYRIILIIAGIIPLLIFFAMPYATLDGVAGQLGQLAGLMANGDVKPEKLTGFQMIKISQSGYGFGGITNEDIMIMTVIFSGPVVLGLIIALLNLLGKGKASYILSIILALLSVPFYAIIYWMISMLQQTFYRINYVTFALAAAAAAVQFIVAIMGTAKDTAAKASAGKTVKVGKNDGIITGIQGAYAGAEIPIQSGTTVMIGRDPSVCSIVIKDEKTSRKHCEIAYNAENGMYAVTDYSSNGTFTQDGGRLPSGTAVPLVAGTEIQIGESGAIFRLG